jgi:hypothetical protein
MLANSDDLVGGLHRIRTCDTLIRSNAAIFQGFGLFQSWNRPENYSIFKESGGHRLGN